MLTKRQALNYAATEIQHLHLGPLKTFSWALRKQTSGFLGPENGTL